MKNYTPSKVLTAAALAGVFLASCGKKKDEAATVPALQTQPAPVAQPPMVEPSTPLPQPNPVAPAVPQAPTAAVMNNILVGPYAINLSNPNFGLMVETYVTNATLNGANEMWVLQGVGSQQNCGPNSLSIAGGYPGVYCHTTNTNDANQEGLNGVVYGSNSIHIVSAPNMPANTTPFMITINHQQVGRGRAPMSRFEHLCVRNGDSYNAVVQAPRNLVVARGILSEDTTTAPVKTCTAVINDFSRSGVTATGRWTVGVIMIYNNKIIDYTDLQAMYKAQRIIQNAEITEIVVSGYGMDTVSLLEKAEFYLVNMLKRQTYNISANTGNFTNGGSQVVNGQQGAGRQGAPAGGGSRGSSTTYYNRQGSTTGVR